jgi:hypothetical protein
LPITSGGGFNVSLVESTRSEVKKTVINQGTGALSESTTCTVGKWKLELTMPFTTEEWSHLDQEGTITLKVGNQTLEKKLETGDGLTPVVKTFKFNLTKPVVVGTGFKYLTLPTDLPPSPAPAPGTKQIFGSGTLVFKGSQLRNTVSSFGNAAPSLAGENFLSLGQGAFQGSLPFDVTVGGETRHAELAITGSLKRKDTSRDEVTGNIVQMYLSGKA